MPRPYGDKIADAGREAAKRHAIKVSDKDRAKPAENKALRAQGKTPNIVSFKEKR